MTRQESDPNGVRIEQNVQYLGASRNEKADLYFPAKMPQDKRLPAVVIIHGGGWNTGVRNGSREINIGTTLARSPAMDILERALIIYSRRRSMRFGRPTFMIVKMQLDGCV